MLYRGIDYWTFVLLDWCITVHKDYLTDKLHVLSIEITIKEFCFLCFLKRFLKCMVHICRLRGT